jgi:hypothetical protein
MKKTLLFIGLLLSTLPFLSQTTFSCTSAASVCPCGAGGSVAEFYAGYFNDVQTYFTSNSPTITRNDAKIDFTANNSWGSIVPPASNNNTDPNTYSTRWSGRIYLAAGTYSFWLTSDDASWLWLGANALAANPTAASAFINNGGLHSAATVMSVGIFTTNCWQDFKLHFGENSGQNRCNLEYASTGLGISRQAIPGPAYCPCMSNAVLPITLNKFYAYASKDNITVYWKTDTEKNNRLFKVYKSADGLNWSLLGEQPGAGTTYGAREYTMTDPKPLPGITYYYLEQVDADGGSEKFDPVWVDFSRSETYLKLFPNPFQDKFRISASTAWSEGESLEVYNSLGVALDLPVSKADKYTFELNTADLPSGNYIVKIKTAYQVIVRKLVKS